jgi:hypothetical protein
MLPILIGAPVAFLPVPLPQTLFLADAFPDPTGPAVPAAPAPPVSAVSSSAVVAMVAPTTPILIVFDLISSFSSDS